MLRKILKLILYIFSVLIILLVISTGIGFLRYRITAGEAVTIRREIQYQVIDLIGLDTYRALVIEPLAGKRRVFVVNDDGSKGWFYVSPEDFDKAWPNDLYEMNYTFEATFKTKKLLFGGYAPAEIVGLQKVERKPRISK